MKDFLLINYDLKFKLNNSFVLEMLIYYLYLKFEKQSIYNFKNLHNLGISDFHINEYNNLNTLGI